MEVKIINEEKDKIDIEIANLTIVEILRVYANKNGAKFAAWKRDHPSKNPILHIEGENPKKILKESIKQLEEEIDSIVDEFKKLK